MPAMAKTAGLLFLSDCFMLILAAVAVAFR
jgi:hypothetical protein